MSVVEVGQYSVTRNAGEFLLRSVACREYTLPRDDPASEPKGWIQGNTRIDLFWKSQRAFSTSNSESKFESNRWKKTILTPGSEFPTETIRYVNNYIKYNTQSLASPQEEEAVSASSEVIAARSKAKAKPQPRGIFWHERPFHWVKEFGLILYHQSKILDSHNLSKKSDQSSSTQSESTIESKMEQFNSTRLNSIHGLFSSNTKLVGQSMVSLFGCRRRIQTKISVLLWFSWGQSFISVLFKDISGDSIIDLAMQDHVLIAPGVFPYIFHVGSNFNISSILSKRIDTWRSKFKQKTICVLLACWSKRWKSPRSRKYWLFCACVVPDTCKTLGKGIRIRYSGLILILESSKKDWSSIRQDRTQSSFRVYFHQIALWELKDWKAENHCIKGNICRLVHHPKISLRHDLNWTSRERWIGLYSWTSTSRETRSTVTWRNSSIWFFQANPIP